MSDDSPTTPPFAETMRTRFAELRGQSLARRPRTGLLTESLTELECAIEELRVTEEELRQHQNLLADAWRAAEASSEWNREMFEGAAEALLATDESGRIRDVNRAGGALFGVRPDHLRGKPLSVFIPEEHRRAFRDLLPRIARERRAQQVVLRLAPRNQEPLWVEAAVAPFDPPGAQPGLHWTLRDVTARMAAEQSRGDAAETLRLALNAAERAAIVLDLDGTVIHWNAAAEGLLGWSEGETAGVRPPAFDEFAERVLDKAVEASATAPARVALRARTRAGQAVELDVSVVRLESGGAARGTALYLAPARDEAEAPAAASAPVPVSAVVMAAAPVAAEVAADAERRAWTDDEARRVLLAGGTEGDLVERLRRGIAAGLYLGHLRPADRLPSIREVARHTGHDHRYVSAAYRRLASDGVVEIRTRHGVVVGSGGPATPPPSNETAAWLADVIGQAAEVQVKVPHLPELVKKWTGSAAVRCLCADGTEDGLVSLTTELSGQWGFETQRLLMSEGLRREDVVQALRAADLVVTTPFHAFALEPLAQSAGVPVVVLEANPELVHAAEERLAEGPLTAVVADPRHGERLRCLAGGERLRIVLADDPAQVAALDGSEPVLLTRAAQLRVGRPLRLLAAVSPAFSPARARELAAVLIRRNLEALRSR